MRVAKQVFSSAPKIFLSKVTLPLIVVLLIVAGSVFLTLNLVRRYPERLGLIKGPEILKKEEEEFLAEVGKSIALPADEKPTIALVSDPGKLGGQEFFKDAKKGDKVLIYTNTRRVILYRPSEKRVIQVGAVNINQQQQVSGEEIVVEEEGEPIPTPKATAEPEPASSPTP